MTSTATPSDPVLAVENLQTHFQTRSGLVKAVDGVSFSVAKGETLGIVGESGSGKSITALSILRLVPPPAGRIAGGRILLSGDDLLRKTEREMQDIRGRRISMILQDPMTSLDPLFTIGDQVAEPIRTHRKAAPSGVMARAAEMLRLVKIPSPETRMRSYPHQMSGGMRQRIVAAIALACEPELLIAGEPTTSLDVTIQAQLIALLKDLQQTLGLAMIIITHDFGVVSKICHRVAVIHRGRVVEQGSIRDVFATPQDDYTRMLLAAVPRPEHRLVSSTPDALARPLIEVEKLSVHYGRKPFLSRLLRRRNTQFTGNRAISLTLQPGEIMGIVGESGSGKSTLAKALTGLNRFEGQIRFDGRPIGTLADMDRAYRRDVQIVFQNPDSSLNPRQRIGEILSRPLDLYGGPGRGPDTLAVARLLEEVRLPAAYAQRFPHQLSGGEKQRVAIARAFASKPRLVICDEITSSLDVSIQAAIIKLLVELQQARGTGYLFITHDLNLVRQVAHRIAVMYQGELVELITVDDLAAGARHAYTRSLMGAVPVPVTNRN